MIETSYNRHVIYCRRVKNRRRSRVRSCRACSAAKAKCSFQPHCLRCTNKGIQCVYDNPADRISDDNMAQITEPTFPSTPLTGDDFTVCDLFPPSEANSVSAQIDIDWDLLDDYTTQTTKTNLPQLSEPFLSSNTNGKHADGVPLNVDPQSLLQSPEPPSTALTFRDESSSALSERARTYERTDSFLARLPISDPVSQFIATSVLEMIRTYPLMMLRTETLPSFIHGHWYRPTNATQSSLPEPLVNCMGIAQIFASHNTESKPYLWNLVKMEQRCFIEKVRPTFRMDIYICVSYIPKAISPTIEDPTKA